MALRLLDVYLPERYADEACKLLAARPVVSTWVDQLAEQRSMVRVLLDSDHSEAVCDLLEERFGLVTDFRLILLAVEATLPRVESDAPSAVATPAGGTAPLIGTTPPPARISRAELYDDVAGALKLNRIYVAMVILSAIVVAVGLLRDNLAIIIGAMVIAPLLGPNIALALATTLGDGALARRAMSINVVGLAIAFAFSVAVGLVLPVDPGVGEIASRTEVGAADIVLALAAGAAGVLAFTTGTAASLVGVMVAVALLPPLATVGLMLSGGQWSAAAGALVLLATNVVCVNLAAVVTFLLQGIRPNTWWKRSRRAVRHDGQ